MLRELRGLGGVGWMLTSLWTCSRHVCFVKFGIAWVIYYTMKITFRYIYIYAYIYIYLHCCIHTNVHVFLFIFMHINILLTYVHARTNTHTHIYIYIYHMHIYNIYIYILMFRQFKSTCLGMFHCTFSNNWPKLATLADNGAKNKRAEGAKNKRLQKTPVAQGRRDLELGTTAGPSGSNGDTRSILHVGWYPLVN